MKKIADRPIRWGIVATGGIAEKFCEALLFEISRTGNSSLHAVASRSKAKAEAFATAHLSTRAQGMPRAYGSYEELFADPAVDIVYIATPHNLHAALSIQALEAGKAVLCEKPVSLAAKEFGPVVEAARRSKCFFMEAMWMRFNPAVNHALDWVRDGRLGDLRYLRCDFFLNAPYDPASRLFDPALGGGALLDVGIYPVTAAYLFAGNKKPERLDASFDRDGAGVDYYNRMELRFASGLLAELSSAIQLHGFDETRTLLVLGEKAAMVLPHFFMAQEARLLDGEGRLLEHFAAPFDCNGYEYEIREVERCLAAGLVESPLQTLEDSVRVMEILDEARGE